MRYWTTYILALLAPIHIVTSADVIKIFREKEIIPQIIEADKLESLKVTYGNVEVTPGMTLKPTQTLEAPSVTWESSTECYLLAMINPDGPNRIIPLFGQVLHWLVGNICGNSVSAGKTIVEYFGAAPPLGTGFHRYVLFLFKQPGKLEFDEPHVGVKGTGVKRVSFVIKNFAKKYKLGPPIAGNFYQAEYDPSSNATLAKLAFQV